jgi:D-arabinose 1-dehydrogenase-like Zn-dependent alcohol dehydrogenase
VFHIPDAIASEHAAPFMCAGLTVYTPMLQWGVKAGDRVGVVGVGGLGHLAIAFAAKMGANVVVFSGTEGKREEALALGAKEFWVTGNLGEKKPEKGLDFLVATGSGHPDWKL